MSQSQTAYVPFRQSVLAAEATEERIISAFIASGCEAHHDGDGDRRDLWIMHQGVPYWIEVKDETANSGTGNICIERRQGKPARRSGIATSESQVWIHVFADDACVLYRAAKMRDFISTKLVSGILKPPIERGDNHNMNVLVPIVLFDHYSWAESCQMSQIAESRVFGRAPAGSFYRSER